MTPDGSIAGTHTTVVVEFDVTRGWLRAPDHHVVEIVLDCADGRIDDVRHFVVPLRGRASGPDVTSIRAGDARQR